MEGMATLYQVNVMAHHEHMDKLEAAIIIEGHNIPYVCRRIRWTEADDRDWFDDMRYKEKDLEWVLKQDCNSKSKLCC